MLARVLRVAGYEVAAFASGTTFLESLATRVPACVVIDVHMPGLSGLEVQSRLRTMGSAIPAVFITASEERKLDDDVRAAQGTALLRKPFPSADLLRAVESAVQGTTAGPS